MENKCPHCDKPKKVSTQKYHRLNRTCGSKECISKALSENGKRSAKIGLIPRPFHFSTHKYVAKGSGWILKDKKKIKKFVQLYCECGEKILRGKWCYECQGERYIDNTNKYKKKAKA